MKVRRSLLCSYKGSALEAMFSGKHELNYIDGYVYLDRNPKIFKLMLDFLRNYKQITDF